MLYATYRGFASGSVYSWDIRSNIDAPLEIFTVPSVKLHESTRRPSYETTTNQRLRFDIDPLGQLLSIGDQVGIISRAVQRRLIC
jgi:telomerase Cajal body protein 1